MQGFYHLLYVFSCSFGVLPGTKLLPFGLCKPTHAVILLAEWDNLLFGDLDRLAMSNLISKPEQLLHDSPRSLPIVNRKIDYLSNDVQLLLGTEPFESPPVSENPRTNVIQVRFKTEGGEDQAAHELMKRALLLTQPLFQERPGGVP